MSDIFDWLDDEDLNQQAQCPCGSQEFRFVTFEGEEPVFLIDTYGSPEVSSGHPVCFHCGLEYLVCYHDEEEDSIAIYGVEDLGVPEEEDDDFE